MNESSPPPPEAAPRSLKSLVNTPWKRSMLIVQLVSYVLIVGSPLIGGAIGGILGLKASMIGGLILGIFIAGEVLFYGSLVFLGKEVVLVIRDVLRSKIGRKRKTQ
ncbi:MAG: hypothetical protein GY790_04420 [Bacteroidetes bacterium]|nr:hypothetical protein [Bacteroidota bacterium]